MGHRWSFFKHSDESFGMFYPRDYILAAFVDDAAARKAEQALRDAGFAPDDVRAADGRFVAESLENPADAGWFDRMKAAVADALGTETVYVDDDVAHARRGGAFVFVHAPEDDDARRATDVLRACNALYARRYLAVAIERLIDDRR